jgi:hypothetical protein
MLRIATSWTGTLLNRCPAHSPSSSVSSVYCANRRWERPEGRHDDGGSRNACGSIAPLIVNSRFNHEIGEVIGGVPVARSGPLFCGRIGE